LRELEVGKRPFAEIRDRPLRGIHHKGGSMLAIAGTGYGLIGLLIIILLVVLIFYFARRA
jgi:hypothetical protein